MKNCETEKSRRGPRSLHDGLRIRVFSFAIVQLFFGVCRRRYLWEGNCGDFLACVIGVESERFDEGL